MKMPEEITIRKVVGTPTAIRKLQEISPLKRAFKLKIMLEELRGERGHDPCELTSNNENVRRIVGRVKSK